MDQTVRGKNSIVGKGGFTIWSWAGGVNPKEVSSVIHNPSQEGHCVCIVNRRHKEMSIVMCHGQDSEGALVFGADLQPSWTKTYSAIPSKYGSNTRADEAAQIHLNPSPADQYSETQLRMTCDIVWIDGNGCPNVGVDFAVRLVEDE